jgi:membrane protein YdbS with pleckstrin-like domain
MDGPAVQDSLDDLAWGEHPPATDAEIRMASASRKILREIVVEVWRKVRWLVWIALAWCAASAALGGYMVWRGPTWWAGGGLVLSLVIAVFAFAKAGSISLATGRGKWILKLGILLWLGGVGMALYAVVSTLSVLSGVAVVLGVVGLLVYLFAPRRAQRAREGTR